MSLLANRCPGDFNFADISRNDISSPPVSRSSEGTRFITHCDDLNLPQLVFKPTCVRANSSNMLDLILITTTGTISSVIHLKRVNYHCILNFTYGNLFSQNELSWKIWNYKRGYFDAIHVERDDFAESFACSFDNRAVGENCEAFKCEALSLIDKLLPTRTKRCNFRSPWFTSYKQGHKQEKAVVPTRRAVLTDKDIWSAYNIAVFECKRALKKSKSMFSSPLPSLLKPNSRKFRNLFN